MIPRKLHFIWMGSPLPGWAKTSLTEWKQYHPTWEVHVWDERASEGLMNRPAWQAADSWSEKSDVMRYELLCRHGGFYMDIDSTCFRAIDDLLDGETAAVSDNGYGQVSSGTLACVPGDPFFAAMVECMHHTHSLLRKEGVSRRTGPGFISEAWARHRRHGLPVPTKLEPRHFFSIRWKDPPETKPHPDAYAVHHFRKSWW
jgi:mannosyltransferase OCH1-like enzyme